MKRRVCCLLLGICMLCFPMEQVYAAPAVGPAAKTEEKEKPLLPHEKEKPVPPHEKKHEKPVPPHEHKHPHDHEHPKPHELKGPLAEKQLLPHEKEQAEIEVPELTPVATPKPTATPETTTTGTALVNYALQFVGNPYKYGGTSLTNGADCSGFVQSVFAHFDYALDRTSRSQAKTAGYMDVTPKESQLQPGDLVFYADSSGGIFHVAIYIGNGNVVHAANSRKGITVSEYDYMKPYKARRVLNYT